MRLIYLIDEKIENGAYTEICAIVDRGDFQLKVIELRKKYQIEQFKNPGDTYRTFDVRLRTDQELKTKFSNDITNLRRRHKRPSIFQKLIHKTTICNFVDFKDFQRAVFQEKLLNPNYANELAWLDWEHSILIYPGTTFEDLEIAWTEFMKIAKANQTVVGKKNISEIKKMKAKKTNDNSMLHKLENKEAYYHLPNWATSVQTKNAIKHWRKWYIKSLNTNPIKIAIEEFNNENQEIKIDYATYRNNIKFQEKDVSKIIDQNAWKTQIRQIESKHGTVKNALKNYRAFIGKGS